MGKSDVLFRTLPRNRSGSGGELGQSHGEGQTGILRYLQEENEDGDLADLSFYDEDTDDYNITIDDVPDCANPGTHTGSDEDTNVLMLHNSYSDGKGTAQKYTSSSTITLEAGTAAVFSVWVKTEDMTFNGTSATDKGSAVVGNRGAWIGVTHTVGGTTLDQMQVKNIDTEAINPDGENYGWCSTISI